MGIATKEMEGMKK